MPRSRIEQIREKIRLQHYDMTVHAMEEMAEYHFDISDIEIITVFAIATE